MAARHVLLLALPIALAQPVWNSQGAFPSVNPWAGLQGYPGLSSSGGQQEVVNDGNGVYQDDGYETYDVVNIPRAMEGVPHGTHFGGDYGFPRYGGRSRVSRYGIDYGDIRARRHGRHYGLRSFGGYYGPWAGALAYGAFGYPAFYGQTYPRWTGRFGGREHPTTFDPYLANPYYQNLFAVKRLMPWYS